MVVINWSLSDIDGVPVFTLRGYLCGGDGPRLRGATGWVSARTQVLVLDLRQLQGCNTGGQYELGSCVEHFAPSLVLCLNDPDLLRLSDDRVVGVPRAHLLPDALAAARRLGAGRTGGVQAVWAAGRSSRRGRAGVRVAGSGPDDAGPPQEG